MHGIPRLSCDTKRYGMYYVLNQYKMISKVYQTWTFSALQSLYTYILFFLHILFFFYTDAYHRQGIQIDCFVRHT